MASALERIAQKGNLETNKEIDWKSLMMRFLKMYGETAGNWYPEYWEEYGITVEEAKKIFKEYEKMFPDDL